MTGAGADRGSTGYINYANVTKFSCVSSNIIHHQNVSAHEGTWRNNHAESVE